MCGTNLVRLVGDVDALRLGGAEWIIRAQCEQGSAAQVAEALARRDDTRWVNLLPGGTEISASLRSWSANERDELILHRLQRTAPVVAVTAHSVLHVFGGGRQGLDGPGSLGPEQVAALRPAHVGDPSTDLVDADRPLLRALAQDGRAPYPALAAATGWSQSRVARRIDALRAASLLSFDVDVDTELLGYRAEARLWASVSPADLAETGATVAAHPEVAFCAGDHRPDQPAGVDRVPGRRAPLPLPHPAVRCPAADPHRRDRAGRPHGQARGLTPPLNGADAVVAWPVVVGAEGAVPGEVRTSLHRFCSWCANSGIAEITRLVTTIETWWDGVEAFLRTSITNAKSEGIDRAVKRVARNAHGFRNPENQRLRLRTRSVTSKAKTSALWHVAEFVELSLHSLDVFVAVLFPVQLQCLPPDRACLRVLSEGGVGVARAVEGVRDLVGVVECMALGEGLVVIVDGLLVVTCAVGNEPEAVQSGCLTGGVVVVSMQTEGGKTMVAGGVELAQACGIPAHGVERVGFEQQLVEGAAEVEGVSSVVQSPLIVSLPSPHVRERLMGVRLFGGIVVAHG